MPEVRTREPIISVLGHIDHGKTTLLDFIRGSVVASREAGQITQHIGATDVPFEVIKDICGPLLEKIELKIKIRGLLFIDTPGHEAFTTLRKRGGSVADLAIVVIDINEGVMPQTVETIQILKEYKTPFVIAANKVDRIRGWILQHDIEQQPEYVRDEFYKKFYALVSQVSEQGFDCDLFVNIKDFTRQIAIVPISAKKGDGIPKLMMVLVGLTQQYLHEQLSVEMTSPGRGTILEVKEEKGLGTTIDVILYDGIIRKNDSIVVGAKEPIVTKVKALLRPKSLDEMRDPREKFKHVDEVYAAFGVKIAAPGLENALAGGPVYVGGPELVERVKAEIGGVEISRDDLGVIVKADTLGSLEAMVRILTGNNIPVRRASIGKVSKIDVNEAFAVRNDDKYLGVVLAFNTPISENARLFAEDKDVRIIGDNVIYKILETYQEWVEEEKKADKERKLKEVVFPARIRILPDHVFRQSNPAIVGIEVLAGTLRAGFRLMREDGKVVGRIRSMQSKKQEVTSASRGDKIAISIENVTIGRQLNENDTVYSFISSEDMREMDTEELGEDEIQALKEIKDIKKKRVANE